MVTNATTITAVSFATSQRPASVSWSETSDGNLYGGYPSICSVIWLKILQAVRLLLWVSVMQAHASVVSEAWTMWNVLNARYHPPQARLVLSPSSSARCIFPTAARGSRQAVEQHPTALAHSVSSGKTIIHAPCSCFRVLNRVLVFASHASATTASRDVRDPCPGFSV